MSCWIPLQNLSIISMTELELDDIQGMLISGYGHLEYSRHLFLQITDSSAAKDWLKQLTDCAITTANWQMGKPQKAVNLAFTYLGLKALGLPEEILQPAPAAIRFSPEFREGMAARAEWLGDQHSNSPEQWTLKYRMGEADPHFEQECHLLLILQAPTLEKLNELDIEQQKQLLGVEKLAFDQVGQLPRTDHFGFNDTVSQPDIEGSPVLLNKLVKQPALAQDVIKPGEFILGYLNENQQFPSTPTVPDAWDTGHHLKSHPKWPDLKDLGRNGSYLVFRKLEQHVADFRRFLQAQSDDVAQQQLLAAQIIGRWPSGAPLVLHPETDPAKQATQDSPYEPENRFGYGLLDAAGRQCPLGAHIRRVNPRDALGKDRQASLESSRKHRILRRGARYGNPLPEGALQDDGEQRGLLFMAINANLQQQFEFIQTMWINNTRFSNLNGETDPLIGCASSTDANHRQYTVQNYPVRQRLALPEFVTLKGGGYFFLPSLAAIRFLATLPCSPKGHAAK
jgi:Dyp-type peroxidase family